MLIRVTAGLVPDVGFEGCFELNQNVYVNVKDSAFAFRMQFVRPSVPQYRYSIVNCWLGGLGAFFFSGVVNWRRTAPPLLCSSPMRSNPSMMSRPRVAVLGKVGDLPGLAPYNRKRLQPPNATKKYVGTAGHRATCDSCEFCSEVSCLGICSRKPKPYAITT